MKIFIPYNFIMSYHEDMHTNLIKCWGRHEGLRSGHFFGITKLLTEQYLHYLPSKSLKPLKVSSTSLFGFEILEVGNINLIMFKLSLYCITVLTLKLH